MKHSRIERNWWGPPKKFTTDNPVRKISWLELFYDLVYVLAIAKITHNLSLHYSTNALLEYVYLFSIVFWGWLNGSLYHDLHGSEGLRTRLMTLWQILIVAAIAVTISVTAQNSLQSVAIVLLIMQLYITYMWWSVGLYDKGHRRLNTPYTLVYLISFALMASSLFVPQDYMLSVLYVSLFFNFIPPFVSWFFIRQKAGQINLSSSMSERLGLFTIIIFGEVMAGIVAGTSEVERLTAETWINFSISVGITFALWWLFFTLVSERKCRPGLLKSSFLELVYVPTLIGLGLLGMAFAHLIGQVSALPADENGYRMVFGLAICLLLLGINTIMYLLDFPDEYRNLKNSAQQILYFGIILLLIVSLLRLECSLWIFFCIILFVLIIVIMALNYLWYSRIHAENKNESVLSN